ncbi:hypothetical protein LY78DRAFT_716946 [Colletotrichum sublineola]|uniref:Uncharacterized protein n=1 Tax=Colletotrichum sublineola TaxID=1173701 RepID=A0A066X6B1_COLSU|nr:hypothetical protein LY78DRAFT_716946 [Colletotrichum sublineola]KDN63179.1 hypothetical protein CSUB01_02127 [Colletotrichum sublineola]
MAIQNNQQDAIISSLFRELPMEIKLDIFEKLINKAYAEIAADPQTWIVDGCEDAMDQIYIIDDYNQSHRAHLRRFQLIRLASQINSTTRELVNRRLPRFPSYRHFTNLFNFRTMAHKVKPLRYIWVCPKYDRFHLEAFTRRYNDDGDNKNTLENAILNATGKSLEDMKHIQRARYSDGLLFDARKTEIQAIASLPKLKSIALWPCPMARPKRPAKPHSHGELQPVDQEFYPQLAAQINEDPTRLLSLWKPLWDAGVRITCGQHWVAEDSVEIVCTDEGLRLRFLLEECNCYEPPQSDDDDSEKQ